MTLSRKVLVFLCVLCFYSLPGIAEARKRSKRELRFPKGSSFVFRYPSKENRTHLMNFRITAVALTSFLPKGPTDGLAHFLEFDLGFPFPDRFAIDKNEAEKRIWENPQKIYNTKGWSKNKKKPFKRIGQKRSLIEKERQSLMIKIQDVITRMGFNGPACTSRLQCELRHISPQTSLLEELLVALFKPPSEPEDGDCQKHSSNCPISLLHVIMHSKQISSFNMV